MTVVDELFAQRDVVLFGKWLRGKLVVGEGVACLVWRGTSSEGRESCERLSDEAQRFVKEAIVAMDDYPLTPEEVWHVHIPEVWNDHPSRTKSEVLSVLDEAIRLAKEASGE